jgi:hypothetical protein
MTGEAWLHEGWIPATEESVSLLEQLRLVHLQALADYQAARRGDDRDAEHRAMVALCDVVDRIVDQLLERRGELESFAASRRPARAPDPADVRAVDQLLIGLGTTGGAINGTASAARYEAECGLARRPVTAW